MQSFFVVNLKAIPIWNNLIKRVLEINSKINISRELFCGNDVILSRYVNGKSEASNIKFKINVFPLFHSSFKSHIHTCGI